MKFKCLIIIISILINIIPAMAQNWPDNSSSLSGTVIDTFPSDYFSGIKVNWARSNFIQKAITNVNDIATLSQPNIATNTIFYDGLGRSIQNVAKQGGGSGVDVVSISFYDSNGRSNILPLPFVLGGTPAGNFKRSAFTAQQNFYNSIINVSELATGDNKYPYSKTIVDDTSYYGIVKRMGPGSCKVGSNTGVVTSKMLNNLPDEVENWQFISVGVPPQRTGVWPDNSLLIYETINERGKRTRQYNDREGKLILSKTEVSNTPAGNGHNGWLCTYYVYDEMNRLRTVITPKVVSIIQSSGWGISQTTLDNLCYSYDYDNRNRIIWKKLPGIAPQKAVYDQNDKLVLSQDGTTAVNNQWMFTKYDVLGRVMLTGKYLNSSQLQQTDLIANLNGSVTTSDPFILFLAQPIAVNNYTSSSSLPNAEIFSINYYDNYRYLPSGYSYDDYAVQHLPTNINAVTETLTMNVTGLATGGMVRVMDGLTATNQWESFATYYDQNGRQIQQQSTNYKGGHDTISTNYNFSGSVISVKSSQSNPSAASGQIAYVKVTKTFYYDNQGRISSVFQQINDEPYMRRLKAFTYNNLGTKIISKTLGTNAEVQNYKYRIWGNIESINKGFCGSGGTNVAFGEIISYDYGFSQKDKSLASGIMWRTQGRSNTEQSYGYSYDAAGRLIGADYSQNNGTGWTNATSDYSARNISYDDNGNLSHMEQWATKVGYSAPFLMDVLNYTYTNNGQSNQPQAVTDNITTDFGLGEFTEAVTGTLDYSYDDNGNMIMDKNKNIESISYNYINKPYEIVFKNNNSIVFSYDAAGTLLSKQINDNGTVTTIDYVGNLEYQNNILTSIGHDEGRVRPVALTSSTGGASWAYEYDFFVKDHQGNVRSVLTEEADANWWGSSSGGLPTQRVYDPRNPGTGTTFTGFTVGSFDYRVSNELNKASVERALFSNVDSTRSTKPLSTDPNDVKATLLNADNNIIGPSIMLRVMAGDKITINTSAYYDPTGGSYTSNATPDQLASALITALTGSGSYQTLNEAGIAPDLTGNAISRSKFVDAMQNLKNNNTADGTKPQAFLNYLMFDEDMNVVDDQSGFVQTTEAGYWNILSVPETLLPRSGYLVVFLSNESHMNVNFDNLNVTHYKGTLKEENQYYPYGLTLTSKAVTTYPDNNHLLGGKELNRKEFSDGTGLNLYNFDARQYDPQIGMWHSIDPIGEGTMALGLYQYCNNNPVLFKDPSGMRAVKLDGPDALLSENWDVLSGFGGPRGGGGGIDNAIGWLTDLVGGAQGSYLGDPLRIVDGKYYAGIKPISDATALKMYGKDMVVKVTSDYVLQSNRNFSKQKDWVLYMGQYLVWFGKGNNIKAWYNASSGNSGSQNSDKQESKDAGPIPEGKYSVDLTQDINRKIEPVQGTGDFPLSSIVGIQIVTWWTNGTDMINYTSGWGTIRARLQADDETETFGRDNFYLHNSSKGFSHGCIETETSFFDRLLNYGENNSYIDVLVKYPSENFSTRGDTYRPNGWSGGSMHYTKYGY